MSQDSAEWPGHATLINRITKTGIPRVNGRTAGQERDGFVGTAIVSEQGDLGSTLMMLPGLRTACCGPTEIVAQVGERPVTIGPG